MKELLNSTPVLIEIGPVSLKALRENAGIELPLERAADGRLTPACREKTIAALQIFLARKPWQPPTRALCGISAHGVSLRKITLPATLSDGLENVLRLQIESEFPLSPDELAWGWQEIKNSGALMKREVIIAAVRKETVEDYMALLTAAGLNPEFTVAAFARELLCSARNETHAVLELGQNYSELATVENGAAVSLKILPANGDAIDSVSKNTNAKSIFVSGKATEQNKFFEKVSARISLPAGFRKLEISDGTGFSAATVGLKKSVAENIPLLRLRVKTKAASASLSKYGIPQIDFSRAENKRWLVRGAWLLVFLLLFPFVEALVLKPFLAHKLKNFQTERNQFVSVMEPEMRFLQAYKQNQPPYLDAIYIFSKAAPPGLHMDSLAISQKGDITLKATLQNAQQVMDFRAKLIASGFFSNLTVEEQTAVPNQQKISVRMTAQWASAAVRASLKIGPVVDKSPNTDSNSPAGPDAGKTLKT